MPLIITIPGKPQPQQRMKPTIRGKHASVYEPAESRNWKATAQQHMADALRNAGDGRPWDCTMRVEIVAIFPLPAAEHRKKPTPRRWHTKANGDTDNISKAVLDAGNSVLWRDDATVVELNVRKFVAAQGESPRVVVRVTPIVDAAPQDENVFAPAMAVPVSTLYPSPDIFSARQTPISGSAAIARRHS